MSTDFHLSEGVATILLNRPDKLNALTGDMWAQLVAHLDRCERDAEVRAVILAGAGRGFCSGADMSGDGKQGHKPTLPWVLQSMNEYNDAIRRLYHLRKPIIAAVQGAAIGIGWTMALCCDWILVTENAKFRPAFLNLAKVPEAGFQYLITRLIGQLAARDIIYRARFVSGPEAVELGLATRLVGSDALMQEAVALAREMAAGPPLAFALTKRLFTADTGTFDQFLEQELNAIAIAANTEDAVEGTAAFREKRPARFTGR